MNSVNPNSKTPSIKEESKSNQGDNIGENNVNVNVQEIISNPTQQVRENTNREYVVKATTTKEDVAIVLVFACLLTAGAYVAWRCDGCPPIQGQVKQLPPKRILDF